MSWWGKKAAAPDEGITLGQGDVVIVEVVGRSVRLTFPMPTQEEALLSARAIAEGLERGVPITITPVD